MSYGIPANRAIATYPYRRRPGAYMMPYTNAMQYYGDPMLPSFVAYAGDVVDTPIVNLKLVAVGVAVLAAMAYSSKPKRRKSVRRRRNGRRRNCCCNGKK